MVRLPYSGDCRCAALHNRLADDPLNDYVPPFGGGYFIALPDVTSATDRYARGLLG